MSITLEFIISILVQLLILAFFVGVYITTIKFMQTKIEEIKEALKEDKAELKADMKRYNNVLERIAVAENSISACHHRVDSLENILK